MAHENLGFLMHDLLPLSLVAIVVGAPLVFQGMCVLREFHGYRKDPKYKDHPEIKGVRKGDRMLYVNFCNSKDKSD